MSSYITAKSLQISHYIPRKTCICALHGNAENLLQDGTDPITLCQTGKQEDLNGFLGCTPQQKASS